MRIASSSELGAEIVAGDDAPPASDLHAEAGDHIGQPLRRVGVARAVLGIAVQRQIGQHDPEAVGQRSDDRLPFAMRQSQRVQKHQRGAGSRLPIGDPRAVMVVVEAQAHTEIVAARLTDGKRYRLQTARSAGRGPGVVQGSGQKTGFPSIRADSR